MREIKFRAWDKNNKLIRPVESIDFDTLVVWFNDSGRHPDLSNQADGTKDEYELMQYTGLHDKNGKEIYEGDCFEDDEDGSVNWVEYDAFYAGFTTTDGKGSGWWDPRDLARYASDYEVIGNTHENPELIT